MKKLIKVGSDFSGVGAFNQALKRLGIEYDELFACDMDKYARQTFELNYGKPKDFPKDVYEREIPKESLDIFMTSPPCQAFSLAGKRLGKEDQRGILFFNSLEFIKENKPRYFIFENVKGLLSHDKQDKNAEYGRTFQEWINYLGGKSVNGVHTFFPIEDSVPYHIYFQVLNAKHYGIPQNRERVFIIGIRDDEDNNFHFPKPFPLEKRLKDVLEPEVDEKYFLSDKMINGLLNHQEFNKFNPTTGEKESSCITSRVHKMGNADNYIKVGYINQDTQASQVFSEDGTSPSICAGTHGYALGYVETEQMLEINENGTSNALTTVQKDNVVVISTNNSKGFDEAEEEEEDSINFSVPSSKTRRGRVGKKVSQTLDTQCNQGIATRQLSKQEKEEYEGVAVHPNSKKLEFNGFKDENCPTLLATDYKAPKCIQYNTQRIRRLTPLECFKLMDFNFGIDGVPDFVWNVSDSQAYKQAGNSIAVGVLAAIISKLNL